MQLVYFISGKEWLGIKYCGLYVFLLACLPQAHSVLAPSDDNSQHTPTLNQLHLSISSFIYEMIDAVNETKASKDASYSVRDIFFLLI